MPSPSDLAPTNHPFVYRDEFDRSWFLAEKIREMGGQRVVDIHHKSDATNISAIRLSAGLSCRHTSAAVNIDTDEDETYVVLIMPTRGKAQIQHDGEKYDVDRAKAVVLTQTGKVKLKGSPKAELIVVWLKKASVEWQLSALLGRTPFEPLRFHPYMPLDKPEGLFWLRAACYFSEEFASDFGSCPPPVAENYERALISAILYGQENNFSDELFRYGCPVLPRSIHRAQRYMQENIYADITTKDIAKAAGISERTLQANFARFLKCSPLQYLRSLRLEGAHQDLLQATREESVTEIAHRWHFHQPGRFAKTYRVKFGETPLQTLTLVNNS